MRKAYSAEKKVTKKRRKKISIFNIVVLAFVAYFVYTLFDQQIQINKYNSQIDMYRGDIQNKEALVDYYSKQKNDIETDEYMEDVARDSLGYVKPYEKIFIDANR